MQALLLLQGNIDLGEGVPRIIVISPMKLQLASALSDTKHAREKGFELASQIGADLQRAEVYLIGLSRDASVHTRDFAHALFLGMKGRLAAVSGEAFPALAEPPQVIRVYGGFIDYVGQKVPMQLRLSIDRNGSLVNSWVEVSVFRPVATPLTGKAICKGQGVEECEIKGDGKEFSQSWVADVRANPTFNEKMPFSGARYFELFASGSAAKGRVYDPNLVLSGKQGASFALPFELSTTPTMRF